jgi:hypothetical protein
MNRSGSEFATPERSYGENQHLAGALRQENATVFGTHSGHNRRIVALKSSP